MAIGVKGVGGYSPPVMPGLSRHPEPGTLTFVRERQPCVYILASQRNGTLYVGVTSDLSRRVWEHKTGVVEGFAKSFA